MGQTIQYFILIPFVSYIISLFVPNKREKILSGLVLISILVQLILSCIYVSYWLTHFHLTLNVKQAVLYETDGFEFSIVFYFDKISAVYLIVGAIITLFVAQFSRTYMHRESGFKRFFTTLLLFYFGYNIIILSGNFETLFIGWEILGICSFLLIAFYRDRFLPVKNALKVIFVYRLGDLCLIIAMWLCHHLWHENITFFNLNSPDLLGVHDNESNSIGFYISLLILIAAAAKSAQLPFSSSLPRAMEGPTTSSAIFYGALAVHMGVFLLLRTYPLWSHFELIKIIIIALGAITAIVTSLIARVQSTVKTQIAYSSIVQIGLIFIEIALGYHMLALFHFTTNAFLRTYQLLVSPSVLSYLGHNMLFNFTPSNPSTTIRIQNKIANSIYLLSMKEFNLDFLIYRYFWDPFKLIGKYFSFISRKLSILVLLILFFFSVFAYSSGLIIPYGNSFFPTLLSFISMLLILRAFTERGCARKSWGLVIFGQLFLTVAILLNESFGIEQALIYLSGIVLSGIVGLLFLTNIKAIDNNVELNRFHGYSYEKPRIALAFFICCLGLIAFPITPTFLGIDLLFTHIRKDQYALILFSSISIVFIEISILRIYARVFLGQHKKAYHPIAYKSS